MTDAPRIRPSKLIRRQLEPELMDNPELERSAHILALRGLKRINFWSRTARQFGSILEEWARNRPLKVLDLACGGGDVVLNLEKLAKRRGLSLQFDGCDISQNAVDYARKTAQKDTSSACFFRLDSLNEELPREYDVLINSLFLHHLSKGQARELISCMADTARSGILISDLERCRAGYWLAMLGTRILSRSPVVHTDSVLSVRAAFNLSEFDSLASEAGLCGYGLRRTWPFRFLLSWRRN